MNDSPSTHPRKEMPPPSQDEDLINRFLTYKVHNEGCSPRTERAYRDALTRLQTYLAGKPILEATDEDLVMFCGAWLHKQDVGAVARRPYVAAVREFFKWATRSRLLERSPAVGVQYPRIGRKLPVLMSLKNAEKLMWAPDLSTFEGVRDATIMSLLMGCGFRVTGLVMLNESNIVHTEHAGITRMAIKVKEKGEKERMVPVPRDAEMLLRIYLAHPELQAIDRALDDGDRVLFVSTMNRSIPEHEYHGEKRRLASGGVRDLIKRHGAKAGIPDAQLHPHAARHLFGTELTESDVDQLVKQELLGHADPKSTKIYTHLAMRKKIQEMDRANPLSKMKTPVSDLLKRLGNSQ